MRAPIRSTFLRSALMTLAFATMAAVASPAVAKEHDRGHRGDRHQETRGQHGRYDRRDRRDRHDEMHYDKRSAYRRGYRNGHHDDRHVIYRQVRPVYGTYYRPAPRVVYRPARRHDWRRGGHYYGPGYGQTYVVNDYYGYGLRQPPRGYYWRRSDIGDFLLVAAATGIIADLVLHR